MRCGPQKPLGAVPGIPFGYAVAGTATLGTRYHVDGSAKLNGPRSPRFCASVPRKNVSCQVHCGITACASNRSKYDSHPNGVSHTPLRPPGLSMRPTDESKMRQLLTVLLMPLVSHGSTSTGGMNGATRISFRKPV